MLITLGLVQWIRLGNEEIPWIIVFLEEFTVFDSIQGGHNYNSNNKYTARQKLHILAVCNFTNCCPFLWSSTASHVEKLIGL